MNRAEEIFALTVPCKYCNAKPFEPCQNKITGDRLHKFAAHQKRITDAKNQPDDEDVPF